MTRQTPATHRSNLAKVIGDILQPTHLLLILVVALLVLGPKRLPEVGRSLGKGLRDFRQAISFDDNEREAVAMPPVLDTHHYSATPVPPLPAEAATPATPATATMPAVTVASPEAPGPTATAPAPVADPTTEQSSQAD
jgi:TatA/E family protein of Tat protein translocase